MGQSVSQAAFAVIPVYFENIDTSAKQIAVCVFVGWCWWFVGKITQKQLSGFPGNLLEGYGVV